ncbi:MAG: radical SAM protein [Treponema sp.]|jgi:hypothetical protein|nr:radical SAM protein [Treponema sp.]
MPEAARPVAQPVAKPLLILAAVHLEAGPEAVPLGAASVASALKAAFPGLAVALAESFVPGGAAGILAAVRAAAGKRRGAAGKRGGAITGVGFSVYSWNRHLCVEAARRLRRERPGLFLFCGGPDASALPGGLALAEGGPFDAVVLGEGERAASRLIGERFFPGRALPAAFTGPAGDLAALPSPWLDGSLRAGAARTVLWELARGCPYHCAYCYESRTVRKTVRNSAGSSVRDSVGYYPEERLREELRLFIRRRVPSVSVLDPSFNAGNQRAVRILNMIGDACQGTDRGSRPSIHWHFEVRAERLTREQVRGFARLGASLQIGLQTSNPRAAELADRDFDRERFLRGIRLLNAAGLSFGLDLIYGLPGDSLGGFRRSLGFALSLYPNNLDIFRLAVLPGTALAERAAAWGLDAEGQPPYSVLSTPDFSQADLGRAERLAQAADLFYNRGRAVAWFNQTLHPLGIKAAAFLEGFAGSLASRAASGAASGDAAGSNTTAIEAMQLAYLEKKYREARKDHLLPAVRDLVHYHGAWGRALAEGLETEISLNYPPELILGAEALDLERFAARHQQRPGQRILIR